MNRVLSVDSIEAELQAAYDLGVGSVTPSIQIATFQGVHGEDAKMLEEEATAAAGMTALAIESAKADQRERDARLCETLIEQLPRYTSLNVSGWMADPDGPMVCRADVLDAITAIRQGSPAASREPEKAETKDLSRGGTLT